MRKKTVKGLIYVLSCALFLTACKDNGGGGVSDNAQGVTVWGMPGTEKVYENIDQNSAYYAQYKSEPIKILFPIWKSITLNRRKMGAITERNGWKLKMVKRRLG